MANNDSDFHKPGQILGQHILSKVGLTNGSRFTPTFLDEIGDEVDARHDFVLAGFLILV
ncbi:MAG: hypothetical protein ACK2UI_12300 [Anaerolineae bacterium]